MMIIKRYIYIITPSYMFRLLFRCHLQAGLFFLKKTMYTIDNTIIDCEILHYIIIFTKF